MTWDSEYTTAKRLPGFSAQFTTLTATRGAPLPIQLLPSGISAAEPPTTLHWALNPIEERIFPTRERRLLVVGLKSLARASDSLVSSGQQRYRLPLLLTRLPASQGLSWTTAQRRSPRDLVATCASPENHVTVVTDGPSVSCLASCDVRTSLTIPGSFMETFAIFNRSHCGYRRIMRCRVFERGGSTTGIVSAMVKFGDGQV
mmetsp:Transcript_17350/g.35760  ORF Transcript_17350/g.35760 Transcript_17350/m.35760 type:complete len:202 (-) Transcript_17350:7-612(-)